MADRPKRLYRVTAYSANGEVVVYRRDYQSREAADARARRLRVDMPSVSITVAESDIVTWPAEDRGAA